MGNTLDQEFMWGGAVSNVQAEGSAHAGGKGPNVYDELVVVPEEGQTSEDDVDVASNHYRQFREDIALMKEMGFKAYRFSIVWSRIHPTGEEGAPNAEGLAYYDEMVDALIEAGITPVASLVHFDMPANLSRKYNGFLSRETVDLYVRHVEQVVEHFKDRVSWWITYNELNTAPFDSMAYLVAGARRPEGMSKPHFFHDIFYNTMLASARATNIIKHAIPHAHVSGMMTLNMVFAERNNSNDRLASHITNEFNFGLYADVLTRGAYPAFYRRWLELNGIDAAQDDMTEMSIAAQNADYLPVSLYQTRTICFDRAPRSVEDINEILFDTPSHTNPELGASVWGWTIDPVGFRQELNWLYQRSGERPIFVVENGIGLPEGETEDETLADDERIAYHREYLQNLIDAVALDGVNVIGYLAWSPIDILSSHREMRKRYGFIYIAPMEDGVMRRIPKKSFAWYREVIASRGGVLDE